jgi:hypothetical protein
MMSGDDRYNDVIEFVHWLRNITNGDLYCPACGIWVPRDDSNTKFHSHGWQATHVVLNERRNDYEMHAFDVDDTIREISLRAIMLLRDDG